MRQSDFRHGFPGKLVDTIFGTKAFIPAAPPTHVKFSPSLRRAEEQALLALGGLNEITNAFPEYVQHVAPLLLRREAVLSSKIEGTSTKIGQLFLFERTEQETAKTGSDVREVLSATRAFEFGLGETSRKPISCALLRNMNLLLLKGLPDWEAKHAGMYRPNQVCMGSTDILKARYVPPPPVHIQELMEGLEVYVNSETATSTLTKIAIVHYQFEAIHPFADGNGRLGRILIALMLIRSGLLKAPLFYMSAHFDRHLGEYVNRLWEVSCKSKFEEWTQFFLDGVARDARDAVQLVHALMKLREGYRQKWQSVKGRSAVVLPLIDRLFQSPVVSPSDAADVTGRSKVAARKYLAQLSEMRILREITGYKRNRLYIAPEIIHLLD